MGVRFSIGQDLKDFEDSGKREVSDFLASMGSACVSDARESGSYKDRTGKLRSSNTYSATPDGLVVENTAEYASDVERKGYEVLSGAFLRMVQNIERQ